MDEGVVTLSTILSQRACLLTAYSALNSMHIASYIIIVCVA